MGNGGELGGEEGGEMEKGHGRRGSDGEREGR